MDNPATRIQFLEEDIVSAPVIVVDQHLVRALRKGGLDRGVDLAREQSAHPLAMVEVLHGEVFAVLEEAESGDSLDVGLDVNFHGLNHKIQGVIFSSGMDKVRFSSSDSIARCAR